MTLRTDDVHVPPAQALLEAGEAETTVLLAAIARRIDELLTGQLLEVVTGSPHAHIAAVTWCRETGHELVALLTDDAVTRFWIRKL